jgi:tRNA-binding EMAP/Myf-like protein
VFSPYIEGGVSYGILLSAKEKDEVTSNVSYIPSGSNETDIKDQVTKNDFSIVVGVGFELLILEIDARYVIGQTKLYKDSDAKVFNRGIILTAGLRF